MKWLLIKNSQYEKTLTPGIYYFWNGTDKRTDKCRFAFETNRFTGGAAAETFCP